jgi:hypothetical protein
MLDRFVTGFQDRFFYRFPSCASTALEIPISSI